MQGSERREEEEEREAGKKGEQMRENRRANSQSQMNVKRQEREGDVLQAVYASRRMRLARKMRSPVPAMIEGSAMNARLSLPHSRMHVCLPTYLLLQL